MEQTSCLHSVAHTCVHVCVTMSYVYLHCVRWFGLRRVSSIRKRLQLLFGASLMTRNLFQRIPGREEVVALGNHCAFDLHAERGGGRLVPS